MRAIKRALQLMLERADLAQKVEGVELLAESDIVGIGILVEAIDFFHEHPEARASQLLEHWRDTPKAAAMNRLGPVEKQLDDQAIENEFMDAIDHLRHRALKSRINRLLADAQIRTLSAAETAEIKHLTTQLSAK